MARLFKDLIVQESDGKPRVTLRHRDGTPAVEDVSVEISSAVQQEGDAWGALHANLLLNLGGDGVPTARTDNPHHVTAAQTAALPTAGGTMSGEIRFPTPSGRQVVLLPNAHNSRGGFALATVDTGGNWSNAGLTFYGDSGAFEFHGTANRANSAGTADYATKAGNASRAESAGRADSAARADGAGRADSAARADVAGRADAAVRADNAGRADAATRADSAAAADSAVTASSAGTAKTAETAGVATSAKGAYGPSFLLGLTNRNAGIVTTDASNLLLACSANTNDWAYLGNYKGQRGFCPNNNSSLNLGVSESKWNNIYAASSTITTSDRNEKNSIALLDGAQMLDFVLALKPSSYKFNEGTSGRTHWGMIAQDVEALLADRGMDSSDFAGFIKSKKADGTESYGLRYEEFIAPLIASVQSLTARVAVLEERLGANAEA